MTGKRKDKAKAPSPARGGRAEEFLRRKGERTGQMLIDAMQASPHRHIEIEPSRSAMPVRQVKRGGEVAQRQARRRFRPGTAS